MIPSLRSLAELTIITNSLISDNTKPVVLRRFKEDINEKRKNFNDIEDSQMVKLPKLPSRTRRKWIKSRKALSKLFNELDYNYNNSSTLELTLISRQEKNDHLNAA